VHEVDRVGAVTDARWIDRRRIRLGDVDPSGKVWLDTVAGFVQDAAADHSDSNGFAGSTWVVRRLELRCVRLPRHREVMEVSTWCSGVGPRWAERTTTLSVEGAVGVTAVAVWVHLDPTTGAPIPLPAAFHDAYGETITNSKVRARLEHGDPPELPADGIARFAWQVRRTDLDLLGHVNNARYWSAVEEVCSLRSIVTEPSVATIEFRGGLDHEPATVVHAVTAGVATAGAVEIWILDADGTPAASVRLTPG
jgi:acyl-ACP thioesterase